MNKKIISALVLTTLMVLTIIPVSALQTGYTTSRLTGTDKFDTAISVSKEFAKNDTITNCIIENSTDSVDNISATPLSVYEDAPILLTDKATLNPKTKQRLADMGIKNIFIVGGVSNVSDSIKNQLTSLGYKVTRFDGANSIAINKTIMNFIPKDLWGPYPKIVDINNWVQGLSVAQDVKKVIDGKTYINPVFIVSDTAFKKVDLQYTIDSVNYLATKWNGLQALACLDMTQHIYGNAGIDATNRYFKDIKAGKKANRRQYFNDAINKINSYYNVPLLTLNDLVYVKGKIDKTFITINNLGMNERYIDKTGLMDARPIKDNYTTILFAQYNDIVNNLSVSALSAKLGAPLVFYDKTYDYNFEYNANVTCDITPVIISDKGVYKDVSKVYYVGSAGTIPNGSESVLK